MLFQQNVHMRAKSIAAFLLFLTPWTAVPAGAHEAPMGWTYPLSCCSNYDCKQVTGGHASGEVREAPGGYVIAGTGEVVPYQDKRIRRSPDGAFHWCAHQAGVDAGRTICLFVPDRGF
jgi:hypothetical protein